MKCNHAFALSLVTSSLEAREVPALVTLSQKHYAYTIKKLKIEKPSLIFCVNLIMTPKFRKIHVPLLCREIEITILRIYKKKISQ